MKTPIEAMAEAYSEAEPCASNYARRPPESKEAIHAGLRAALMVLAEMELSEEIIRKGSEAIDWGGEFCEDAETLFRAILRKMIEEDQK